ncbi:hypothetical protein E3N88_07079 [Mikania micrantha]|uniref:Uncharacterized protein n=1 Tax=Mikania micrantha TaxID=192012 RepID=A0A5N6PQH4_9ASTR|nr:hypothetical protein E3N88_07079 [Mikania micrantha]
MGQVVIGVGPDMVGLGRRIMKLPFWAANPLGFSLGFAPNQGFGADRMFKDSAKVRKWRRGARTGGLSSLNKNNNENPIFVVFQTSLPRDWLDETAIFLYFRVEFVESFAWTPRTPKSVEK